MLIYKKYFKDKKIIITGHTGFKGSWLTLCLSILGANILGISKDYPLHPCHFKDLKLDKKIKHHLLDIKDVKKLKKFLKNFNQIMYFILRLKQL